jgi:hypothetical protein
MLKCFCSGSGMMSAIGDWNVGHFERFNKAQ